LTKSTYSLKFMQTMIDAGLKVDSGNHLINLIKLKDLDAAYLFMKNGANVNLRAKDGTSPLYYIFGMQDLNVLKQFLKSIPGLKKQPKININIKNHSGMNLMHEAMNNSVASIDASFEFQKILIENKIDFNAIDNDGRTPLHYAFIKKGERGAVSSDEIRDPIEIVSNMLSLPKINLNVKDKWGRTPLHYACQFGAVTSALYIM